MRGNFHRSTFVSARTGPIRVLSIMKNTRSFEYGALCLHRRFRLSYQNRKKKVYGSQNRIATTNSRIRDLQMLYKGNTYEHIISHVIVNFVRWQETSTVGHYI